MSAADTFAQALTDAGSRASFEHDGLIYTQGVPAVCVKAYAAARLAGTPGPAILAAMVGAYMGAAPVAPDDGRSFVWLCARAWAARCGALERQARGLAA